MKKKSHKIILLISTICIICVIVVLKSVYIYDLFHLVNMPVFDGVMNEKNQFHSFVRFKGNFSLMERLNQVVYEFQGNPLSGGFGCFIALFAPKMFANDWDIYIRGFISSFVFSVFLSYYLKSIGVSLIRSIIFVGLILNLSIFYDFRIGLVSYIPEVSSTLFLLSGYLSLLIFTKNKSKRFLFFGLFFMFISIISRFNFFVYVLIFLIPFIFPIVRYLKCNNLINRLFVTFLFLFFSIFLFVYVKSNLKFFLDYYMKPVSYQEGSISFSFKYFIDFIYNRVGVFSLLTFIYGLIIITYKTNISRMEKLRLCYPFIFSISFFILFMKATQPHIFVIIIICFIPVLFIFNLNYYFERINFKYLKIVALILFIFININFVIDCRTSLNKNEELQASKEIANYIYSYNRRNKNLEYLCLFDEQQEIPIEVYLFKKTKKCRLSNVKFYLRNWNFYDIDKKLNEKSIFNYYKKYIDSDLDLIIIDKNLNKRISNFDLASKVNRKILIYLMFNSKFKIVKKINNNFYGELLFFQKTVK